MRFSHIILIWIMGLFKKIAQKQLEFLARYRALFFPDSSSPMIVIAATSPCRVMDIFFHT